MSSRKKSRVCCRRVQRKNFNVMKQQEIKSRLKTTRTVLKQSGHREVSPPSTSVISQNSQSTGLVYDERMLKHKHEWFIGEQESPRRIQQAFHRCVEENLVSRCIRVPAIPISEDDLTLVHDKWYVEKIKQSCYMSNRELYSLSGEYDGVFFNRYTWLCATLAAGSVKHLTELIITNQLSNGLALIRPPGHHAMRSEACGYCIFNNIAITVASLLQPHNRIIPVTKKSINKHNITYLQRILIIDWDVHHGQGTQYTFYNDNRVLYISIHRYEKAKFWPNLREANYDFIGENLGKGYNVNIPLEEIGMTDSDYLAIFYRLIMPIATEFNPQLILVSCGFDAAIGCPEGRMWLTPMIFGHFIHKLKSLAGGKVVVVLEGGYFVDSLAEGIVHVLKALLGDPLSPIRLIQPPCSSVKDTIESCITVLSPYWKSLLNSSQPVQLESMEHLPTITWPIVKVITWPETNPQLPRVLTNYIQHLINNQFPAPLSISNEIIQQMTLILMLTSQASELLDLQYESTNVHERKRRRRRRRKQQKVTLESLTHKLLNDQLHIHLYNKYDAPIQVYSNSKSSTKLRSTQSSYSSISSIPTNPINNPINTIHPIDDHIHSIDQLYFKQSIPGVLHLSSYKPSLYDEFIQPNKQLKDLLMNKLHIKCNCLSYLLHSKYQIINDSLEYKQRNVSEDFQTTIIHALCLILMGQFHQVYFVNHSFSLIELIETITNIPMELIIDYRKRIFKPKDLQMNTPNDHSIDFMSNTTFINNNDNKILQKLSSIYSYPNRSNSFPITLASISSSSLFDCRSQINKNENFYNRPYRILVLDLNGIQQIDNKQLNQFQCLTKGMNRNMKCHFIWCSIYYDDKWTNQLLIKPNELCAKDFYTYDSESNHNDIVIHHIVWLKIPLPTGIENIDNMNETINHTNKKLQSKTVNHDINMINLLSILYHIFLPISYEYEPDLIYLLNGSNQMKNEFVTFESLARIIYLINGLSIPILINGSSINELSSNYLIQCLHGKPITIGFNEFKSISPSSKMKRIIQLIIQQNHQRWKCLGYF
ncbi:unnamed protein product [Schistosoma spindalis]|nr:unnamed protein product [Schistosoma spindale]